MDRHVVHQRMVRNFMPMFYREPYLHRGEASQEMAYRLKGEVMTLLAELAKPRIAPGRGAWLEGQLNLIMGVMQKLAIIPERDDDTAEKGVGGSALLDGGSTREWRRIREEVLDRDQAVCAYCGGPADRVDHVLPRKAGGTDALTNLVASCNHCNQVKHDKLLTS